MDILALQAMEPASAPSAALGSSCTSSTSYCCKDQQ